MGSGVVRAVIGALAASVALALPVHAQEAEGCIGVEMQPARVASDLEQRADYRATVRNCTDERLRVTTTVAALGHDLDGAPAFFDSAEAEAAIAVSGLGTFTLAPQAIRTMRVRATIPSGERSLYGGIVAEFERPDAAPGSSVTARQRVAGMLLMRGAKPWVETAAIRDVGLTPNGDGTFIVFATVEDTGNVHIAPTGQVVIRQGGEVLDRVNLTGGTILPGFKRRLTGRWAPAFVPDGSYRLTGVISGPGARGSTVVELTGGGSAEPAARIAQLVASDAEGAFIAVVVENTGSVPITPNVQISVTDGDAERARHTAVVSDPLPPGESTTVTWQPALADGAYLVTARARQDDVLLDEKITGLRVGPAASGGSSRAMWITLAALLLLLVIGVLAFLLWRRRRRDDDERDAPPPGRVRAGRLRPRTPARHP